MENIFQMSWAVPGGGIWGTKNQTCNGSSGCWDLSQDLAPRHQTVFPSVSCHVDTSSCAPLILYVICDRGEYKDLDTCELYQIIICPSYTHILPLSCSHHTYYIISISLSVVCMIEKMMKEERGRGEEEEERERIIGYIYYY